MKKGTNRRVHWLRSRGALYRLEPDERKPSCPVPRGGSGGNAAPLPDQTLETKAKFISQVMTGETTARRIEDLDAPALTYAEVKAIASGNPMIVEKAKVDAEVMKLSRLRAEHAESQFSHRGRLRMLEQDVTRLERQMGATEMDVAMRQDTQGDKFKIVLDGEVFTDRVKAGSALIYLVEDHRTDHLLGRPSPAVLGEFAGFKLEYRSTLADKVTLRGASEYVASVSPSPVGTIGSLEHAARSVEDQVERTRQELARTKRDMGELSKLAGGVWEHEEHYRTLVKRQAELVDALDLTKNQAAAQLATESEETETVASPTPADEASEDVRAGADESVTVEPEAGEAAKVPGGKVAPAMMTPSEARKVAKFSASGKDAWVSFPGRERWLSPGSKKKELAIERAHRGEIARALDAGEPVSAAAVATYKIQLPDSYGKEGDRFVSAGAGRTRAGTATISVATTRAGRRNSTPPELMSPQQFKAAGLGPANDAIVLKAARQRKPVSALAVDEYNLKSSLPKGYTREGDRFVFKKSSAGTLQRREKPAPSADPGSFTMRTALNLTPKRGMAA